MSRKPPSGTNSRGSTTTWLTDVARSCTRCLNACIRGLVAGRDSPRSNHRPIGADGRSQVAILQRALATQAARPGGRFIPALSLSGCKLTWRTHQAVAKRVRLAGPCGFSVCSGLPCRQRRDSLFSNDDLYAAEMLWSTMRALHDVFISLWLCAR